MVKRFITAATVSLCSIGAASAQSPVGEWMVKDQTAHIRIVSCGNALWGVINWTKGPAGKDENNPDPAKRDTLSDGDADPDQHEACRATMGG